MVRFRVDAIVGTLAAWLVAGSIASGGVLRSAGQSVLFGQPASFQEWDIRADPVGAGASSSTGPETDARSLVFHDGALYVGSTATLGAAGPTKYLPGPSGMLSVPASPSFEFLFPADRPRAGLNSRQLAINTSGTGFGAYGAGQQPTLTGISVGSQEPFNPGDAYYTISATQPNATISAPATLGSVGDFRPTAFAFSHSTNRFVTADGGPISRGGSTVIRFHSHTSGGIDFVNSTFSFQVDPSAALLVRGIAPISGSFASTLLGDPVSDGEVLLTLVRYEDGRLDPNELRVYSMSGVLLGTTVLGPSALNDPTGQAAKPSSLAVDEASGLLFVGEQIQGRIFTFQVPAPSSAAVFAGTAIVLGRRRSKA